MSMSDDQLVNERIAQKLEGEAYQLIEAAIGKLRDAAELSAVRTTELEEFLQLTEDAIHVGSLDRKSWEEAINNERNGD